MERLRTILVVDDCHITRNTVRSLIRTFHPAAMVIHAHHGAHAWEMLNSHGKKIDMVITDQQMPEMGGIELVDRIRNTHPHVRIVLMSSEKEPSKHNAHAFMGKPFQRADLMIAIKKALQGIT